jgi:hypothetical protein
MPGCDAAEPKTGVEAREMTISKVLGGAIVAGLGVLAPAAESEDCGASGADGA